MVSIRGQTEGDNMKQSELANVQKRFDVLFDEQWTRKLTTAEQMEYLKLQQILLDVEDRKNFYKVIASGDYRTA